MDSKITEVGRGLAWLLIMLVILWIFSETSFLPVVGVVVFLVAWFNFNKYFSSKKEVKEILLVREKIRINDDNGVLTAFLNKHRHCASWPDDELNLLLRLFDSKGYNFTKGTLELVLTLESQDVQYQNFVCLKNGGHQ